MIHFRCGAVDSDGIRRAGVNYQVLTGGNELVEVYAYLTRHNSELL